MTRSARLCLLLAALAAPLVYATSAMPDLRAEHAWIRLMPGDLPSAGYLVIHNDGDKPRSLKSVTSDAFGHVMLHESMRSSGVQHMRMLEQVTIPAHDELAFKPGSYHLMLMDKQRTLQVGQHVVMTLHFADGGSLSTAFEVRPANTSDD